MGITVFSEWLHEHRRGALDDELSAALAEVTEATQAVGDPKKWGELTITIKVNTTSPDSPTVMLVDAIKVKKPEFARPASVYYLDVAGGLTRHDPTQTRLPLSIEGKGGDE